MLRVPRGDHRGKRGDIRHQLALRERTGIPSCPRAIDASMARETGEMNAKLACKPGSVRSRPL